MAKYGLSTFLNAPLDEKAKTYGTVAKLAGAISYKETLTQNSFKQYSDNVLKFEDTSVTGGSIALEVDDDDPVIFAPLLGQKTKKVTIGETTKDVFVGNSADISTPVGFGFIENERSESGTYFRVKFYPKVTFAPYATENATKKDQADYKNPSVTGTLSSIENGDYLYSNRFETMVEALQVLYALFGATPPEGLLEQFEADAAEALKTA